MMTGIRARGPLVALVVLAMGVQARPAATGAVEIAGTVIAVTGTDVRLKIEGDQLPSIGDEVKISFRIPGGPALKVGTWRVSSVSEEAITATLVEATGRPAVDQIAVISSASPTRRGATPGTTAGPAPPGPQPAWAPGASAPSPFPRRASIARATLPLGPMRFGNGRFERAGAAFVIRSADEWDNWEAIATEPAREFYASVRIRVERAAAAARAVVGLVLFGGEASMPPQNDTLFFGKDDAPTARLARFQGNRWIDIPLASPPPRPVRAEDIDWFEVVSHAGRYEFRVNGGRVATLDHLSPRPQWVMVYVERGNRAEFHDWIVERPD